MNRWISHYSRAQKQSLCARYCISRGAGLPTLVTSQSAGRGGRALVADAWQQVEVPLAEDLESYDVQILDGALIKRMLTSGTTDVRLCANARWHRPQGQRNTAISQSRFPSSRQSSAPPAPWQWTAPDAGET